MLERTRNRWLQLSRPENSEAFMEAILEEIDNTYGEPFENGNDRSKGFTGLTTPRRSPLDVCHQSTASRREMSLNVGRVVRLGRPPVVHADQFGCSTKAQVMEDPTDDPEAETSSIQSQGWGLVERWDWPFERRHRTVHEGRPGVAVPVDSRSR